MYSNKDEAKSAQSHPSGARLLITWGILIALTLLSAALGSIPIGYSLLVFFVLLIVFVKNQQIIDVFMGLKSAPKLWRWLMQFYTLFIVIAVGLSLVL